MIATITNAAFLAAQAVVRPYLSHSQYVVMNALCYNDEEAEYYQQAFLDLAARISAMPEVYGQEALGENAVVYLHYFLSRGDWYITEKDMDGALDQAFGFAVLTGCEDCAEVCYLSIAELVENRAELDLHFTPCTLAEIRQKHAA